MSCSRKNIAPENFDHFPPAFTSSYGNNFDPTYVQNITNAYPLAYPNVTKSYPAPWPEPRTCHDLTHIKAFTKKGIYPATKIEIEDLLTQYDNYNPSVDDKDPNRTFTCPKCTCKLSTQ